MKILFAYHTDQDQLRAFADKVQADVRAHIGTYCEDEESSVDLHIEEADLFEVRTIAHAFGVDLEEA